jgi:hypothetical protein
MKETSHLEGSVSLSGEITMEHKSFFHGERFRRRGGVDKDGKGYAPNSIVGL